MKVETTARAKVRFDWKTKEYKTEIFTPQKMNEVVSIQNQVYHYIKPDVPRSGKVPRNLKIRKIPVEIDQLGQVLVIHSKKRCARKEHCRYEEWILRTLDGKFVTVRGGKVTLDAKPQLIRVSTWY